MPYDPGLFGPDSVSWWRAPATTNGWAECISKCPGPAEHHRHLPLHLASPSDASTTPAGRPSEGRYRSLAEAASHWPAG